MHRYDGCDNCKARSRQKNQQRRATPGGRAEANAHSKASMAARRAKQPASRLDYIPQRYGISIESYLALVESQDGHCAICGDTPARLHIDHDHASGRVRGLLCGHCNKALGLLRDNPQSALNAAAYLKGHS